MDTPAPGFDQRSYWDRVAPVKTFSIPLDFELLAAHAPLDARVLDLGCGYGRLGAELWSRGYRNIVGLDNSPGMIDRGRREYPQLDVRVQTGPGLPFEAASFDVVLLIAVLTCIPDGATQRALLAEIHRVLRPGGLLWLSDYPLQSDVRNLDRYARDAARFGTYGIFELPEGVIVRHHDLAWLKELTRGYDLVSSQEAEVVTMNAHPARIMHMLLRRPTVDPG